MTTATHQEDEEEKPGIEKVVITAIKRYEPPEQYWHASNRFDFLGVSYEVRVDGDPVKMGVFGGLRLDNLSMSKFLLKKYLDNYRRQNILEQFPAEYKITFEVTSEEIKE